jgi:hypothetical protein
MSKSDIYSIFTTINDPDDRVYDWEKITKNKSIVIGDKKTPTSWKHSSCSYISIDEQHNSEFTIANILPDNHYAKKNIGYLYAIKNGAKTIIDTDDDNFPEVIKWNKLLNSEFETNEHSPAENISFKNIYSYFSNSEIPFWPRGFPLNFVNSDKSVIQSEDIKKSDVNSVGLWQCMVEGDPDIDAIHRLIFRNSPSFSSNEALIMGCNNFCAVNSQNTLWSDSTLFPLLYLPSTVSFRFTDILRGYVAQAAINVSSKSWGFYSATSYQERNDHSLMNDFRSEVSMYSNMEEIFQTIYQSCKTSNSIINNLMDCYISLSKKDFVKDEELRILSNWLTDLNSLK